MFYMRYKTQPPKNKRTVFVTFSSKRLNPESGFSYKDFIKVIEEDCNLHIKYRWFARKRKHDPDKIHYNAVVAINEADFFIAEVSVASIGVGQQIAHALQKQIPTFLCLRTELKDTNNLSFLKGTKSRNLHFIYYTGSDDLKRELSKKVSVVKRDNLEKFNFLATRELKQLLKQESEKRRLSQSALLREIIEEWANNKKKSTA
ncbi:hypothetical protein FJZ40_00200 [Candidatus Shapirobacteria bacterium]|nr:hypothetical protein [Candidatus Shapirobacteria bacterium]